MTLLSYEIFSKIIEQGSFAKAAESMSLTPSAVSHAVSSMEEEIGAALFIRDKSGVRLTSAGEQLYPYIRKVLQANEGFAQAIDEMRGLETGLVRLGCPNTVCLAWMPGIIKSFKEMHPNVALQISQGAYSDVNEWTKRGIIDVGILSMRAANGLEFDPLYEDELLCVTPKGYFDKSVERITPDELWNQPFVVKQGANHKDKDDNVYLYEHHLEVRADCQMMNELSSIAMVECGVGLAIMPELFMKNNTGNVDVYPLEPREYRVLGLCYADKTLLTTAARALSQHIKEYVEEWQQK